MAANPDPVSVLCFGDSLTWGFNPADRSRWGHEIRWTRRLQAELGPGYYVLEDGVNGRTTVHEDPIMGDKNGLAHLRTALKAHNPIDVLVLMLGTNNLKARFGLSAYEIALSLGHHLELALNPANGRDGTPPAILLMAPPPLGSMEEGTPLGEQFNARSIAESRKLAPAYKTMAAEHGGVAFFDAGTVLSASPIDAIHFDAAPQADLARAVAEEVRKLTAR